METMHWLKLLLSVPIGDHQHCQLISTHYITLPQALRRLPSNLITGDPFYHQKTKPNFRGKCIYFKGGLSFLIYSASVSINTLDIFDKISYFIVLWFIPIECSAFITCPLSEAARSKDGVAWLWKASHMARLRGWNSMLEWVTYVSS